MYIKRKYKNYSQINPKVKYKKILVSTNKKVHAQKFVPKSYTGPIIYFPFLKKRFLLGHIL